MFPNWIIFSSPTLALTDGAPILIFIHGGYWQELGWVFVRFPSEVFLKQFLDKSFHMTFLSTRLVRFLLREIDETYEFSDLVSFVASFSPIFKCWSVWNRALSLLYFSRLRVSLGRILCIKIVYLFLLRLQLAIYCWLKHWKAKKLILFN